MYDYIKALNGKEYFADKPYKVNFKILDATTQVPSFGKGDLDIMTTTPSFMPRVMEQYDLDLQFFFPLARWTIGPQILVPRNSPYKTLESLKGKRLAIQPLKTRFGSEEAAIQAATGENIRSYFKLKETDAAAQELALGRVEAAFLEAPATYPLLEKGKFKPIWSVKDGFVKAFGDPAVMNGGLIARKSFIEDNPEFIDDLVAAFQDAWSEYQRDPDKVNSIASKESGIPAAQLAVVGEVLNLTKMTEEQKRVTEKDVETWEKMFGYLEESGFIKEAPEDVPALFKVTE
jgi:ABC-type nitrate/sulfonate/bicarbonate transport system substrate-binding protein